MFRTKKKKNSNLWEHCVEAHGGREVEFGYKVDRNFQCDILGRQLDEAMRIESEPGTLLNDKREWVRPATVQLLARGMWE